MKKKIAKVLALGLVVGMALTGCGGSDDADKNADQAANLELVEFQEEE